MSRTNIEYPGKDLESMHFAVQYHSWILDVFKPFIGSRLVEVGAGSGSFSELLLELSFSSISLVEPSAMFTQLSQTVELNKSTGRIFLYNDIFSNIAGEIKEKQSPDSIFYINVLEHIEDDESELNSVFETLEPGGRVFIFVPANAFLFSKFDNEIGHFRRYDRKQLERKLANVGFELLLLRWFDLPGILPWFIKFKLMGATNLDRGSVLAYDKYAVPLVRKFETAIHPPIGKNLIAVAEKPNLILE